MAVLCVVLLTVFSLYIKPIFRFHHRSFHGPLGSNLMNALKTEPSLKDLRTESDRRCHMILLLFHLLTMVYTTLVT